MTAPHTYRRNGSLVVITQAGLHAPFPLDDLHRIASLIAGDGKPRTFHGIRFDAESVAEAIKAGEA